MQHEPGCKAKIKLITELNVAKQMSPRVRRLRVIAFASLVRVISEADIRTKGTALLGCVQVI
jgi:hypothetical protein